jgi:hypothetical protein
LCDIYNSDGKWFPGFLRPCWRSAPGRHDIRVAQGTGGKSVIRLLDDGVDDADAQATSQGWDIMLQRLQKQVDQH